MSLRFISVVFILCLSNLFHFPAQAKRLALVIGNDDYEEVSKLRKAVNDAEAISGALKKLGYSIMLHKNIRRRDMNIAINDFASRIESGDEVVFYYAGHGVEISGGNYLLATDIPNVAPGSELLIKNEAFSVNSIIDVLRHKGSRISVIILDACRNNPFKADGTRTLGSTRGLARIEPPKGAFIMYSAGIRQRALDRLNNEDTNPNSVYTRRLLPLLSKPGLSLTAMAKQLRREVEALAKTVSHDQYPAYYDQVKGDYYFIPGDAPPPQSDYDPEKDRNDDKLNALQKRLRELEDKVKEPKSTEREKELERQLAEARQREEEYRQRQDEEARQKRLEWERQREQERERERELEREKERESRQRQPRTTFWNHNRSTMRLKAEGKKRWFYYERPRSSLARSYHVRNGTLLFNGQREGNSIYGTARIFTTQCGVYEYQVSGYISQDQRRVVMNGRAPRVNSRCRIYSYKDDHLVFEYLYSN